jgi:hypothetical protein
MKLQHISSVEYNFDPTNSTNNNPTYEILTRTGVKRSEEEHFVRHAEVGGWLRNGIMNDDGIKIY